jgi:hypothetical protein
MIQLWSVRWEILISQDIIYFGHEAFIFAHSGPIMPYSMTRNKSHQLPL